jgi:hypothetical protein
VWCERDRDREKEKVVEASKDMLMSVLPKYNHILLVIYERSETKNERRDRKRKCVGYPSLKPSPIPLNGKWLFNNSGFQFWTISSNL